MNNIDTNRVHYRVKSKNSGKNEPCRRDMLCRAVCALAASAATAGIIAVCSLSSTGTCFHRKKYFCK